MSDEELQIQSKCKQRFKGIENFLRSIAFNLGNTPSQTEVKIISCIPIDVTDLQEKIVNLEKQLNEAKQCTKKEEVSPTTQVSMCKHMLSNFCDPIDSSQINHIVKHSDCVEDTNPKDSISATCTAIPMANENCYHQCTDNSILTDRCRVDNKRNIFRKALKKKEAKKKDSCKQQFIYYAQTTNSPFNNYDIKGKSTIRYNRNVKKTRDISRSYFVDMIRRQYQPRPIFDEFSDTSQFTSPICRDIEQSFNTPFRNKSDVCSCCHGQFHNLDHPIRNSNDLEVNSRNILNIDNSNKSNYYDSSMYDVIPVKEKSAKNKEISRIKHGKRDLIDTIYPADATANSKRKPRRFEVNFHTLPQAKFNYPKKLSVSLPVRNDKISRTIPKRAKGIILVNHQKPMGTSDTCIDCGDVYVKQVNNKPSKKHKLLLTYKNAESLTVNVNDTECQTTTTNSIEVESTLQDSKTEETLNQIKTILQSVLTEVKTNTQLKKLPEDKPTKDATVQKGASHDIIEDKSSLLHSVTYSPYNMNPYNASCSRHMSSGHFCYSGLPCSSLKYMQNFPVFIQTPGRHMYANCYRNNSHVNKPMTTKQAATISTNTEIIKEERSKETDKLIKDIYRSIALNIDVPTKDTSMSEYEELSSKPDTNIKSNYRVDKIYGLTAKTTTNNVLKRDIQTHSTFTSNTLSKLRSNTVSMQSHVVSTTDKDGRPRSSKIEQFLVNRSARHSKHEDDIDEQIELDKASSSTITINEDTEISDEETESEDTYIPPKESTKKKEKVNLFCKMFNSVKFFKNKNKKEKAIQNVNEYEQESDMNESDEYETIYSQKIDRTTPVSSQVRKKAPHSKISYSRQMRDRNQERFRRLPYMEQEYRRQWNERLMFQEQQRQFSSDRMYSKETNRYKEQPMYCRNYEARSALVDQNISPYQQREANERYTKTLQNERNAKRVKTKGLTWLTKRKLGLQCGEQWKKLIIDS
ncbi:uncharacterized protein LOC131854130 [Achroia grisella]|uniref:uncharacterized protein LOC131854130 n=1 Tax=Achroia grisella TaxID=688607 RepID=UPI0027D292B8|nr:uncharacterized protein LOC131854130 [Achroia grisella]